MTARRPTPAEFQAASRKHSTAAGSRQAPLASPLTDEELRGSDDGVAITDVDCTPRPRYGESQERFQARMRSYGVELEVLRTDVKVRNRRAALYITDGHGTWRADRFDGTTEYMKYFTQCACGFCGLQVLDPEVARREYDAHPCAAESVGQSAVDRAIAETDRTVLVKRPRAVLQPTRLEQPIEDHVQRHDVAVAEDDTEQRMALLEIKR